MRKEKMCQLTNEESMSIWGGSCNFKEMMFGVSRPPVIGIKIMEEDVVRTSGSRRLPISEYE